jgi:CBS domain.
MLVSEILAIKGKVLFTIAPNRRIAEAVEIMNEQDVGSLVVFSRGEMVGMLTFREVLVTVQKAGADWQSLTVGRSCCTTRARPPPTWRWTSCAG